MTIVKWGDFAKIDMRAGRIIKVEDFPEAKVPTYKVIVDFGPEVGHKTSSVQAKTDYRKEELLNREVVGVVNFESKSIAGFMSEVLLLGVHSQDGGLSLLEPSRRPAELGSKVY